MGTHLIDGEFQSDKYPTCPRGKVPLSTKDPAAQDLLWVYAQRRRSGSHGSKEVDGQFADDVEEALRLKGFDGSKDPLVQMAGDLTEAKATAARWQAKYEREARSYSDVYAIVEAVREALPWLRSMRKAGRSADSPVQRVLTAWDAANAPVVEPDAKRAATDDNHEDPRQVSYPPILCDYCHAARHESTRCQAMLDTVNAILALPPTLASGREGHPHDDDASGEADVPCGPCTHGQNGGDQFCVMCLRAWGDTLTLALRRANRMRQLDYELVKTYDVYGTGGDLSGCLREMLRIITADLPQAIDKAQSEVDALREVLRGAIAFTFGGPTGPDETLVERFRQGLSALALKVADYRSRHGTEHETEARSRNSGGLTSDQLVVACANIGFDLTCGACAGQFYTGATMGEAHTCPSGGRTETQRADGAEAALSLATERTIRAEANFKLERETKRQLANELIRLVEVGRWLADLQPAIVSRTQQEADMWAKWYRLLIEAPVTKLDVGENAPVWPHRSNRKITVGDPVRELFRGKDGCGRRGTISDCIWEGSPPDPKTIRLWVRWEGDAVNTGPLLLEDAGLAEDAT